MTALSAPRRAAILVMCLTIAGLEGYDIQAFGVAAPQMARELGLEPEAQGWLGSAAMLGLVVGAFGGGYVAERFGRRLVLTASTFVFAAFSIATGLASDLETLFVVRLAAGLGFGGAMPTLIAIAAELSGPKHRTLAVTTMFCGLPAGAAGVALLARSMGEAVDWRTIFVIGGVAPLLLAPLVPWLTPRSERRAERTPSAPARDLLGQGRAVPTLLVWATFATTLLIVYLMLNWLPTLVIAKGLSASTGATAALVFNLASIAGALAMAMLVDRRGFRWPLAIAYGFLALVVAAMSVSDRPEIVLLLSAAAGFLVVGPQCALYALIPVIYPPHARVLGAGAAVGMGRFGSIVGPLIAGSLRAAGFSADQVFLFMSPLALAAGLTVFLLGRSTARAREAT